MIAETGDSDTADGTGTYRIDDTPLGLDGLPTEYDIPAWLQPASPAATYDVAVQVREAIDGALGDIELAAVTFRLDDGRDGSSVVAGTFEVVDSGTVGDGVGEVTATIPVSRARAASWRR